MRIFYLRNSSKFPVACVISERRGDKIQFAVSTHNPVDRYSRFDARGEACIKILTKDFAEVYIVPGRGETKKSIVKFIADPSNGYPFRTQEAARLWLQTPLADKVLSLEAATALTASLPILNELFSHQEIETALERLGYTLNWKEIWRMHADLLKKGLF